MRVLLRGSLLYGLGNFLPRVGTFVLLPVYTAAMGPGEFGIFSLMLALAGVLAIVIRLGLDGALMRLHFDVPERARGALYATLAAATGVVSVGLLALVALIGAPLIEHLFAGVDFWPVGTITLILTFALAIGYLPLTYLRASQMPGAFLGLTVVSFLLGVAATLVLVLVLDLGAAGALMGQTIGTAVVAVTAVAVFARLGVARPRADLLRRAAAFGIPLVPHGLSGWVLNLSDRWLIAALVPGGAAAAAAAVGVYAFGYVLGQAVSLVAFSINAAWVPFFYGRGAGSDGPAILREATTCSVLLLCGLAVGIGLMAPELAVVLGADRWAGSRDAPRVTAIVAFSSTIYGLYYMVVSAIFLLGRTGRLALLTMTAGAVNIGANVLFLPRLGIVGAAWATVLGYGTLTVLTIWYARRSYPLDLDAGRLTAGIGGTAVALAGGGIATDPIAGTLAGGIVHAVLAITVAVALAAVGLAPFIRLRTLLRTPPPGTMPSPEESR